jgi:hypothetical protein
VRRSPAVRSNNDSATDAFTPHAGPGTPEYKTRVAEPTMTAIDAMPRAYRELVHAFGYVDVYRAWKRNWSPEKIRASVRDGEFSL